VAVILPLRILRARVSVPADRPGLLSLWSNASGTPAEVTARAGNGARVLHEVYLHCTDGQDDTVSQRIRPTHRPRDTADGPCNRSLSREKPVTRSSVTDTDLRKVVAGVGFEPT
jgi:hypothetical protein